MDLRARRIRVCCRQKDHAAPYRDCDLLLYAGVDPAELARALESRFETGGIVALVDERDDSVVSLAVAAQSPEVLDGPLYRVLARCARKKKKEKVQCKKVSDSAEEDDGDDDEVENEEEKTWLEQARLLMVVTYLEDHGELNAEGADVLRRLVSEADERTMGAMQLYLEDADWDEFRDTMQRIAQIEVEGKKGQEEGEGGAKMAPRKFSSYEYDEEVDDSDYDSEEDSEEEEEDSEEEDESDSEEEDAEGMDKPLMYQVIMALFKRGLLNKVEALTVKRLVDMESPLVLAASQVFQERGDEEDFADTLRRICDHVSLERVVVHLLVNGYLTKEEARLVLLEFRNPTSLVSQAWQLYCEHKNQRILADQLLTIIICHDKKTFLLRMHMKNVFDKVEVTILLDLLHNEDPALVAVFDLLLSEGDLADALDSMKRLCLVRSGKMRSMTMPSTLDHQATEVLELVHALGVDKVITELQYMILNGLIVKQDERVMAAYETYCASSDLDDLIDTLNTISLLAAPEVVAPSEAEGKKNNMEEDKHILDTMFHLVFTGLLGPEDASYLSTLLPDGDPRLFAAFDVYELEGDLVDLADTLERIVTASTKGKPSLESFDEKEEDLDGDETDDEEDLERGNERKGRAPTSNIATADSFSLDGTNETITDDDYGWLSSGEEEDDEEDEA